MVCHNHFGLEPFQAFPMFYAEIYTTEKNELPYGKLMRQMNRHSCPASKAFLGEPRKQVQRREQNRGKKKASQAEPEKRHQLFENVTPICKALAKCHYVFSAIILFTRNTACSDANSVSGIPSKLSSMQPSPLDEVKRRAKAHGTFGYFFTIGA